MNIELGDSFQNICPDCPGLKAMDERVGLILDPESGLTPQQEHEAISLVCMSAYHLEQAAAQIACKTIVKDFSDLPEEVPPTGDPARVEYVRHCPSYSVYKKIGSAPLN